jgi:hypothetical protein
MQPEREWRLPLFTSLSVEHKIIARVHLQSPLFRRRQTSVEHPKMICLGSPRPSGKSSLSVKSILSRQHVKKLVIVSPFQIPTARYSWTSARTLLLFFLASGTYWMWVDDAVYEDGDSHRHHDLTSLLTSKISLPHLTFFGRLRVGCRPKIR